MEFLARSLNAGNGRFGSVRFLIRLVLVPTIWLPDPVPPVSVPPVPVPPQEMQNGNSSKTDQSTLFPRLLVSTIEFLAKKLHS